MIDSEVTRDATAPVRGAGAGGAAGTDGTRTVGAVGAGIDRGTPLTRAVVLAGGLSYEREVSLRSGRRVLDALRGVDVDAILLDADAELLPALATHRPDALFITLHGGAGEDGAIRAVLDVVGVPYVGTPAPACRIAFDKPSAKETMRRAGLTTPDWVALPHATFRELGATAVLAPIIDQLGLPLVVKPAQGGSAFGVTVVRRAEDLPAAMVTCFSYGDSALVERFVDGIELAVGVVDDEDGLRALPPVEIQPVDGVYDYAARYTAGATEFFTPARVSPPVAAAAVEVALRAHEVLGLRDLSRTDLIVTSEDNPGGGRGQDPAGGRGHHLDGGTGHSPSVAATRVHLLEVNVSPGLTETSLLPLALAADGTDLGRLCRALLLRATRRAR